MPYSLKTSGQALDLVSCVMVDDDGSTIVDLCGNALTRHASVTIGDGTWKGVARKYFETKGSGYNAYNVTYDNPPQVNTGPLDPDGMAVFFACAGSGSGGGLDGAQTYVTIYQTAASASGLKRGPLGKPQFRQGNSSAGLGATTLPNDLTTPFSVAANWHSGVGVQTFYGLGSGNLAADSAIEATGTWGNADARVRTIGSMSGHGYVNFKPYVVCVFKSKRTLAQMQALHNNWFGELIETAPVANVPSAPSQSGTTDITQTSATARWVHTGNNATGYEVRYQTPPGSGPLLLAGTVGPTIRSYTLEGLSPGTQYRVVTRTLGAAGNSGYSTGDTFTTASAQPVSQSITVSPDTVSVSTGLTVQLSITRSASAPSGGIVYNLASSFSNVASVPATVTMAAGSSSVNFNATGASIGTTTVTATSSKDSAETGSSLVTVTTALTTKIRVLTHVDALGSTGVRGIVFLAPSGGRLVGNKVGEFSGAAFGNVAEDGKAPLRVNLSSVVATGTDRGVNGLTTSDPLVVYLQDADEHTPLLNASIIEE